MNLIILLIQKGVEMADLLRSSGKIYVVVGVILIIFLGLALMLLFMDRRIGKLENELRRRANRPNGR